MCTCTHKYNGTGCDQCANGADDFPACTARFVLPVGSIKLSLRINGLAASNITAKELRELEAQALAMLSQINGFNFTKNNVVFRLETHEASGDAILVAYITTPEGKGAALQAVVASQFEDSTNLTFTLGGKAYSATLAEPVVMVVDPNVTTTNATVTTATPTVAAPGLDVDTWFTDTIKYVFMGVGVALLGCLGYVAFRQSAKRAVKDDSMGDSPMNYSRNSSPQRKASNSSFAGYAPRDYGGDFENDYEDRRISTASTKPEFRPQKARPGGYHNDQSFYHKGPKPGSRQPPKYLPSPDYGGDGFSGGLGPQHARQQSQRNNRQSRQTSNMHQPPQPQWDDHNDGRRASGHYYPR